MDGEGEGSFGSGSELGHVLGSEDRCTSLIIGIVGGGWRFDRAACFWKLGATVLLLGNVLVTAATFSTKQQTFVGVEVFRQAAASLAR